MSRPRPKPPQPRATTNGGAVILQFPRHQSLPWLRPQSLIHERDLAARAVGWVDCGRSRAAADRMLRATFARQLGTPGVKCVRAMLDAVAAGQITVHLVRRHSGEIVYGLIVEPD